MHPRQHRTRNSLATRYGARTIGLMNLLLLFGSISLSGCATTNVPSSLAGGTLAGDTAEISPQESAVEWTRRTRDARLALQGQEFREARMHLVAALVALDSHRMSDVRYQATMGHLVHLAAIYGRLGHEEKAEEVMTIVTEHASRFAAEDEFSRYDLALAAELQPSSEALRYDALYRDWLSGPLEPRFRQDPEAPTPQPRKPTDLDSLIARTAHTYQVDPKLVKAVVAAESNFEIRAVSPAGAQGLMQLMPETSREMGVRSPFHAGDNLRGGVRYLRKLLDRYRDLEPALAAYNAGPSAVDRYGGIPPFPETRAYVQRVLNFYQGYQENAND